MMKRTAASLLIVTLFVTGILDGLAGIDLKKAFAFTLPNWYLPMSGGFSDGQNGAAAQQSFQTDLFTGAAQTSVSISTPPGRNGLTPQVGLNYSSSSGNGWLGVGWGLDQGFIQRSTKRGVPTYNDEQDTFVLLVQGVYSELVRISSGEYHVKNKNGEFLKILLEGERWRAIDKSGTQYFFGESLEARQFNSRGIFSWFLEKVKDVNGNVIEYFYTENQNEIYLQRIEYNGNEDQNFNSTHSVEFVTEDKPDVSFSYLTGARVTSAKRLKEIIVKVQSQIARIYYLTYEQSSYVEKSRLISVQECGTDSEPNNLGSGTCLPATVFTYQNLIPGFQAGVVWNQPGSLRLISSGNDIETISTEDMTGDGLPDRVEKNSANCNLNSCQWRVYKNTGNGFETSHMLWGPVQAAQSDGWLGIRADSNGTGSYVNLMDFNGDGRPDRTVRGNSSNWMVQYNQGLGFNNQTSVGPILQVQELRSGEWYHPDGFDPDTYRALWDVVDMNGDGFLDRVRATDNEVWGVYWGNLTGFSSTEFAWNNIQGAIHPGWPALRVYDADTGNGASEILDVNGDGLPDRVIGGSGNNPGGSTGFAVQYNTGLNFESMQYFGPLPPGTNSGVTYNGKGEPDNHPSVIRMLFDLNQDGLADRIHKVSNSEWHVFFNTGSGFSETPVSWGPIEGYGEDRAMKRADSGNVIVDYFDINGDSLPDRIVSHPSASQWLVQLAHPVVPDLMSTISNGRGAVTRISYMPSTHYYNGGSDGISDLAFPLMTVSSVIQEDGLGNSVTTSYQYADGMYDAEDREFRGFNRARVIDIDGNYTDTFFKQDDIHKGKPYLIETRDSEIRMLTQVWNEWHSVELHPGVYFSRLFSTTNRLYDGDATQKITETRYLYDNYGNVREVWDWGEIVIGSNGEPQWGTNSGDEKRVLTQYNYNQDLWIMNKPKHVELQAVVQNSWQMKGDSFFYYDGAGFNAPPVKGLLTKKEEVIIGIGGPRIATRMTYDDFGNLETIRDGKNYLTTNEYDSVFHLFLTRVTNHLGHSQQFVYDPLHASIVQTIDLNNQVNETQYDALGRTVKVIAPYDSEDAPTQAFYYDDRYDPNQGLINKVVTYQKENPEVQDLILNGEPQPGYLTHYSFLDGLGREIQKRSPSENSNQQIVSGNFILNNRGLVARGYASYFAPFRTSYATVPEGVPFATFWYDASRRKIETNYPDGTSSKMKYDDFKKVTIDQNGHSKQYTQDAYGNIAKAEECIEGISETGFCEGGTIYTTTYQYDVANRLLKTIDHLGNMTEMTYDFLGRKRTMDDPNMGHWEYTYDNNHNLLTQKDAKNETITFEYDELNRLTRKIYPDQTEIRYVYDSCPADTCGGLPGENYPVGRLLKVIDFSGTQTFRYDKQGRVVQDKKDLDNGESYSFTRIYDPLGRVKTLEYPDGDILHLTFNGMGEGETLILIDQKGQRPIVSNVDYNASGQIIRIEYGNGVATNYFFNPLTFRLQDLQTLGFGNTTLQQFHYEFDNVGNVREIIDSINSNSQYFEYDDLDRLTLARNDQGPSAYGTHAFQYNPIGNMIQKGHEANPATLEYLDSLHKHAVTRYANGNEIWTYQYDLNGNMIRRKKQGDRLSDERLIYDYDNRLKRIEKVIALETACEVGAPCPPSPFDPHLVMESVYDASGQRVKKTAQNKTTYYLGKDYEIEYNPTSSLTRKAFFLGDTRISEKEISAGGIAHFRFFHQDHLGSTNLLTNEQGAQTLLMEYLPYGEVKVRQGADPVNNTFTGQKEDLESSLMYYNARFYDPKIGRFITADTIVADPTNPQDLNRYSYCNNNPIKYIDPSGHKKKSWWKRFWKKAIKAFTSAAIVVATAVLFAIPGGQGAALGTLALGKTYLWAAAAAASTLTLDTGSGRKFQGHLAKEVFDDALGFSPRAAAFAAGMVSHTVLSSAYYTGLSSLATQPGVGTDFTQKPNQNKLANNAPRGEQPGGEGAGKMLDTVGNGTAKADFLSQGLVSSDIAFKNSPGIGQLFKALDVRHFAFTRQLANGGFIDSAQTNLNAFPRIYGSPWTGISHQAGFNELIASGASGIQALGNATAHGGWSFHLSSAVYGVNGKYGVSGINAGLRNHDRE